MNQYSKIWYKYPTNGMNKYSKDMVEYPTKHSNNIQNKGETNKQQQPRTVSGIQLPETLRNTSTELTPPPPSSARRSRPSSTGLPPPPVHTAPTLRITSAGYIIPPWTSARSNPTPRIQFNAQTREYHSRMQ